MTLSPASAAWIDAALDGGPEFVREQTCIVHGTRYIPQSTTEGVAAWLAGRIEWPAQEVEARSFNLNEALVRSAS